MDNDVVKGSFQHDNLATLGRTAGTVFWIMLLLYIQILFQLPPFER